jgi:SNF2 family DNA or RNA helicase
MDPITVAAPELTDFQCEILADCLLKKNGGLSLPMGTGKTLLSLMTGLHLTEKPILVVASKSLIHSWIIEIKKFFKSSLKYEVLHKEAQKNISNWNINPETKVVLTTPQFIANVYTAYNIEQSFIFYIQDGIVTTKYYKVPNEPYLNTTLGESTIYSIKWGTLIVDEVQTFTKITTNICKALSSVCAEYRWLLSGTMFDEPNFERIFGYYIILNHPNVPRSLPECVRFVTRSTYRGIKNTLVFRSENNSFQQPKVNSQIINHALTENESKIYLSMKMIISKLRNQLNIYITNRDVINTRRFSSYILSMISYLRQGLVCPLIPITNVSIDMADYTCRSELSQIFFQEISNLNLNQWLNDPDAMRSSRINACLDKINCHLNERIVIFSCFRTCLTVLNVYLPKHRKVFTIGGTMSTIKRGQILEDFSKTPNGILLLTYDVGSNGLNLQCSNTVMLLDYWWNAGKTKQAIARVLRYGQTADIVNIYYFTSNTGLEENLYKKQKYKLIAAEELLNGSIKTTIPKLSIKDILKFINTEDNINILKNNLIT